MSNIVIDSPLFSSVKPTSNLVRPDFNQFMVYLQKSIRNYEDTILSLESRLASLHDVEYCITMNSGFWALALLIDALHLQQKREIILPSLTYRRMADIISWCGLVPHFCDIERMTLANSANTVLPCLSKNTALIIGVHPVGSHCDISGLEQLAVREDIPLLFDSVESVHEKHDGKRIGSFGTAELFSLGASKLINGFEGGYVTTNDGFLAKKLRSKRCGSGDGLALSVKLPFFHAAMALAGLDDLPDQLVRNQSRFEHYVKELRDLPGLRLKEQSKETEPSYKNIVVEVLDEWPYTRDETIALLNAENILARAYYSPPLTFLPINYKYISADLPNTDWAADRFISMPCGHLVSLEDISMIVDFLRKISINSQQVRPSISRIKRGHRLMSNKILKLSVRERNNNDLNNYLKGIFDRQYYTESGPLLRKLEIILRDRLDKNNVVCVANASIAWMMLIDSNFAGRQFALPKQISQPLREATNWLGVSSRIYTDIERELSSTNNKTQACDEVFIVTKNTLNLLDTYFVKGKCFSNLENSVVLDTQLIASLFEINASETRPDSSGVLTFESSTGNFGFGACIYTDDEDLADALRCMRSSGGVRRQVTIKRTVNGRMSEAQAAFVLSQLDKYLDHHGTLTKE